MTDDPTSLDPSPQPVDGGPLVVADVAESFACASFQDAIPVIRWIPIKSSSGRRIDNCRLEPTASSSFLRPKSRRIDRLLIGDRLPLSDRKESSGAFVRKSGTRTGFVPDSPAPNDDGRRAIDDIAPAELATVVLDHPDILEQTDPARHLARLIGVKALAAGPRARLDEAIERARSRLAPSPTNSVS